MLCRAALALSILSLTGCPTPSARQPDSPADDAGAQPADAGETADAGQEPRDAGREDEDGGEPLADAGNPEPQLPCPSDTSGEPGTWVCVSHPSLSSGGLAVGRALWTIDDVVIDLPIVAVTREGQAWFVIPAVPAPGGFFEGTLPMELLDSNGTVLATTELVIAALDVSGIATPGENTLQMLQVERQMILADLPSGALRDQVLATLDARAELIAAAQLGDVELGTMAVGPNVETITLGPDLLRKLDRFYENVDATIPWSTPAVLNLGLTAIGSAGLLAAYGGSVVMGAAAVAGVLGSAAVATAGIATGGVIVAVGLTAWGATELAQRLPSVWDRVREGTERLHESLTSTSSLYRRVVDSTYDEAETATCGGCLGDTVCNAAGQCVACGQVDAPCCTASASDACIQTGTGTQECEDGTCIECGLGGQACCLGDECTDGSTCDLGVCAPCGTQCATNPCTVENECCSDTQTCSGPGDLVCNAGTCYAPACFEPGVSCTPGEVRCGSTLWPDVDGTLALFVETCAAGGSCGAFGNWYDKTWEVFAAPAHAFVEEDSPILNWGFGPSSCPADDHCVTGGSRGGAWVERCTADPNCPVPMAEAGGWRVLVEVCPSNRCNATSTGCCYDDGMGGCL